jgi:hypothetical protein
MYLGKAVVAPTVGDSHSCLERCAVVGDTDTDTLRSFMDVEERSNAVTCPMASDDMSE